MLDGEFLGPLQSLPVNKALRTCPKDLLLKIKRKT